MRSKALASIFSAGLLAWCALAARPAAADSSCSKDSDCPKGLSCQVSASSNCAYACAPGEICDPPAGCAPVDFKSCLPAACKADQDCGSGMVCHAESEAPCAAVSCPAGQVCPEPACPPQAQSTCTPSYTLPCNTAKDCGSGFTCDANPPTCTCSGGTASGSSGSADGGAPTPPVPDPAPAPDCTCEPATGSSCNLVPVTCTADSRCAAGWTCAVWSRGTDCAASSPPPSSNGMYPDGAVPAPDVDGGSSPASDPPCTSSPDVKRCFPPLYGLFGGGLAGSFDGAPNKGGVDAGTASESAAPTLNSGADSSATSSTAGCSMGAVPPRTGAAGATLLSLGVLGVWRRRRALRASR